MPKIDRAIKLPMNKGGGLAEGLSHEQKFVPWLGELLDPDQTSLVETFVSIQGEGECIGIRSLFIRTSQCNLRCSWCDTKYSFVPTPGAKHGLDEGHHIRTIDDIIDETKRERVTHVVLTGGEPTVQPYFVDLVLALKSINIHLTVETNGTILHPEVLHLVDLWSIAPKLNDGSNMTYDAEVMDAYLRAYDSKRTNVQIKWVSTTDKDLEEAFSILHTWRFAHNTDLPPIWFHPNGMVDDEIYPLGCKWLAEAVLAKLASEPAHSDLEKRFLIKVGLQYHRLIWGHTLGT